MAASVEILVSVVGIPVEVSSVLSAPVEINVSKMGWLDPCWEPLVNCICGLMD